MSDVALNIARDERIYCNLGNQPLIDMFSDCGHVLDIGCGAGANAALIKQLYPNATVSGVTCSQAEAQAAASTLDTCWVFDIENCLPDNLAVASFDTLIFSHVLEHLRDPARVLAQFADLLQPGGQILIAVPNVLGWRQRIQFLRGKFEYESAGVLDNTHLRFFTYYTADRYLLAECANLSVAQKSASGSVPLWWLRRYVLPTRWSKYVDRLGCKYFPNLFGGQILLKAIKQ